MESDLTFVLKSDSKLCSTCSTIFQGHRKYGATYPFLSRFWETSSACSLCNILASPTSASLDSLNGNPPPDGQPSYVWSVYRGILKSLDDCYLSIRYDGKRPQIVYNFSLIRTAVAPKNEGRAAWENAVAWIKDCDENHQLCQREHGTPDRLLDVQGRLIHLRDDVRGGQYATLSHCWGPEPDFYKLTQKTFSELQRGVEITRLAPTFQEAIDATRRLGLHYLWVDALCIVQDSREDWLKQAPQMAGIYSKSYINFTATDSSDSTGGLTRTRGITQPFQVVINWEGIATDLFSCYLQDPWSRYMKHMPTMSRAWIFQERILSRTLHFAADQLLWECNTLMASETFPEGSPFMIDGYHHKILNGKLKKDYARLCRGQPGDFLLAWETIVEQYTGLLMTKESDKLMALSSVAATLVSAAGGKYFAGLWSEGFELALLWHCTGYGRRPLSYQAPSWSWASLVGPVWLGGRKEEQYETLQLEVLEVWTTPVANETGPVKDGILHVRSRMCAVRLGGFEAADCNVAPIMHFANGSLEDEYDFIFPDEYDKALVDVYCLEITAADTRDMEEEEKSLLHARGLLLEPDEVPGRFHRVGMYHLLGDYACQLIDQAFKQARLQNTEAMLESGADAKSVVSIV